MALTISTSSQYAVRVLVHLARHGGSDMLRIREIAGAEDIPYPFLAKLVGRLVQAGFVDSHKGPLGGIRLAQPATGITLLQILNSVEGASAFDECILGLPSCSDAAACLMHKDWKSVQQRFVGRLCSATVADLARDPDGSSDQY